MIRPVISLKNEDLEKAMEIKAFLEINYAVHQSYDNLVRKFGINELKLKRAFKVLYNCTVHEYLTKVRIEQAKALLVNTDRTIRNIAQHVGLDKSNFIKQFKNITGKTPTEWRNNHGLDKEAHLNNTGT